MKTILQIEFSPGILEDRAAILRRYGCTLISVLEFGEAQAFSPLAHKVGVVAIGHGAPREEREQLVSLIRVQASRCYH